MYRHVIQVTDYMLIPDFLFLSGTILQYILRFLSQLMYLPTLNLLLSNRRPFYLSVSFSDVSLVSLLSLGVLSTAGRVTDSKVNNTIILKSTHKPCHVMLLSIYSHVQGKTRYSKYSHIQIKSIFMRHYIGFSYCLRLTYFQENVKNLSQLYLRILHFSQKLK